MSDIAVLIVDDHAILRSGLKLLLNSAGGIAVAGEAATGREALELYRKTSPDVVILDLSLPDMGGLEVARAIRKLDGSARILVLTMHENSGYVGELLRAGVSGYVVKRSADSELINAVKAVRRGDMFIDPSLTRAMLAEAEPRGGTGLSRREEEVLRLLVRGYLGKEIASRLGISAKTVETYRLRICSKLGLSGRAELLKYAVKHGLFCVDPE